MDFKFNITDGNYNIREINKQDLSVIAKWPKFPYPNEWANFQYQNVKTQEQWLKLNLRNNIYWFIVTYKNEIIARGSLIKPAINTELILGIVVKPNVINLGHGTKIIQSLSKKIFENYKVLSIWLESKESNSIAIHTWLKNGFKQISEHYKKDNYGNYHKYLGFRLQRI